MKNNLKKQTIVEKTEQLRFGLNIFIEKLSRALNLTNEELNKMKIVIKDGEIIVI